MEKRNELSPLQKLFVRKPQVSTERLRKFYEKMQKDPQVPKSYKAKNLTPERVASSYLRMYEAGNDLQGRSYIPTLIHEYVSGSDNYRLIVRQGVLSDYEICYPATHFLLEKNGELIKETAVGASLLVNIQIAEVLEYARIMYGEEMYARLMELVAKKVEVLGDAECDASYDLIHRSNQRKLDWFMKLDKIARKMYREVKAINKENDIYERTRKAIDIKNDSRKQEFDNIIVVDLKRFNGIDDNTPPKIKSDEEKTFE